MILIKPNLTTVPCSVADLDLGSGDFLILDPGSQTHIFDSLMTNFWVKSTIILSVFA